MAAEINTVSVNPRTYGEQGVGFMVRIVQTVNPRTYGEQASGSRRYLRDTG